MEHVYLGRESIVYNEDKLFAYEILYRDKKLQNGSLNDRFVSASVINNVLNKFGTQALLGNHKAFVKINYKFLMSDIIFSIPREFFIFSILPTINMDEKVVERVTKLHLLGYKLCIDDTILNEETLEKYRVVFDTLAYYKIDLTKELDKNTYSLVMMLQERRIKVIGSKIDTKEKYKVAQKIGCNFFQGAFLAKPNIVESVKYDPKQFNILKLYNLLIQDTNIDELTSAFEENHAVTVQLLQFINSGYFHFRKRISSIHHILTLVGRRPLAEWLMLMLYSKAISKNSEYSPLMLLAKSRTELMQKVLKILNPEVGSNALGEAYFVGVLSLIDVVFSMKLDAVLEHMYISDEVKNALLEYKGVLGEIYLLVRDIEAFNTDKILAFRTKHKIEESIMNSLVLESIESVNTFENSVKL